jgi:hypothetical protein
MNNLDRLRQHVRAIGEFGPKAIQPTLDERIRVGMTGTREGCTDDQLSAGIALICTMVPFDFHHGDCIGADEQIHNGLLCIDENQIIVGHPPTDDRYRAHCDFTHVWEPEDYITRNQHIVDATDLMFAFPKGKESRRSGTWSTVRYAHKKERMVTLVWPDGTVEKYTD